MQEDKLQYTKKKLTAIFIGIVFCLILLTGSIFLGAKYINSTRLAKQDFLKQSSEVTSRVQDIKNFEQVSEIFERVTGKPVFKNIRENTSRLSNQISFFILDSDNTIMYKNLLENPDFDDISLDDIGKVVTKNNLLIWQNKLKNSDAESIIFYKSLRYDISDLRYDFLILFLCTLLLSGVVYFIWYKFIEKTLIPVEENMKGMSDFIHNAGHELKTPLAVIRGNLQIMNAEKNYDAKLTKKSISELDRANDLIEWLRELSELGTTSEKSNIALATEVKKILELHSKLIKQKWIDIKNNAIWSFVIHTNIQELHILLSNLIKNAIIYNTEWWSLKIWLNKNILSISDTGRGMPEEEIWKIFDRLYRGGESRNTQWFGIGLSLVKKVIDINNWKLEVESVQGKGSTFHIIF